MAKAKKENNSLVLIGTYKGNQLEKWPDYYNYPISDADEITKADAKRIEELWLFKGTTAQKTFSAKFIGIKTREELIEKYAYPATGKAHSDKYLLFKITPIEYPSIGERKVILRTKDFAASKKLQAQLKAYLESDERNAPEIAAKLPEVVNTIPKENLCVCETAIQMDFLAIIGYDKAENQNADTTNRNIWDSSIPVEKSSYLCDNSVEYINVDGFSFDKNGLTMLDLFCGAGGFAVGAAWSGFQSLLGIDHLAPAMNTWTYNHPNSIGCLGDIKKIDPREIKKMLEDKGVYKINLITGGVPCQGFSRANRKHNDNDERNFLFREYMRFVKVFTPDYIILENVSGMRSTAGGHFEEQIKISMEELGYTVSIQLVNSADYGVPQIRQRLLFVGVRNNVGLTVPYKFPEGKFRGNHRTVHDAIADLPALDNNQQKEAYENFPKTEYQKLMRGKGALPIKPTRRLFNHVAPNHLPDVLVKIAGTKQGAPMYSKFKQRIRLSENTPSPTQLAGGIRPQFQFGHPTQIRGLSIRERARIQSFPDSYVFRGGMVQERVQTGNAVPPLLIHYITKPIAEDLKRRG